jgi:hypothetical protein
MSKSSEMKLKVQEVLRLSLGHQAQVEIRPESQSLFKKTIDLREK